MFFLEIQLGCQNRYCSTTTSVLLDKSTAIAAITKKTLKKSYRYFVVDWLDVSMLFSEFPNDTFSTCNIISIKMSKKV